MSGFSSHWLALREAADARARDAALPALLAAWAAGREPLAIVDLGSGTGSNRRWLMPRLPVPQRWRLVENDPSLIAAGNALNGPDADCRYVEADLAASLESALVPRPDLVTASALIDLCSAAWLQRLLAATLEAGAALLIALTYDGRVDLDPAHPLDGEVVELVNRHQRQDKGLGPALGPDAASHLAALLEPAPGQRHVKASDWVLGTADKALQGALIEGWAGAAIEIAPTRREAIEAWCRARLDWVSSDKSRTRVGHQDLLFLPG